jgi:hypothetical protein
MKQQPIRLPLAHARYLPAAPDFANDHVWANHAVVLCADVINLCFSTDAITVAPWLELRDRASDWDAAKPSSFAPVYCRAANILNGEVFPEIWFLHTCHGALLFF